MTSLPDRLPVPDLENTAAVIVSFHPGERFGERLTKLCNQFAAVFWVDNTPGSVDRNELSDNPRLNFLPRGTNTGLASALNTGCEAALGAGFQWVVTFDQDSDIADDFLSQQIDCWAASEPPPFILGCNYSDGSMRRSARFKEGRAVTNCKTVITSGSLMCLSAWNGLGRFRDDYFIDGLDHEFCLRGRSRGLHVARHGRVLMNHRIGERAANFRALPYLHTPVRKYYSMRNGTRNIIQYASGEPVWAVRKCATLAWELVVALLVEPDKRRKSRAMFRGLRDGLRGKMGVAPDELSA